MLDSRYTLIADIATNSGESLGAFRFDPDWYPAEDCLRFEGMRLCRQVLSGQSRIEPLWDTAGAPLVRAFRLLIEDAEGGNVQTELPLLYFQDQVRRGIKEQFGEETLKRGDLQFTIAALPATDASRKDEWTIAEIFELPIAAERSIQPFLEWSQPVWDDATPKYDDFSVFVWESVLKQSESLKMSAESNETGGLLIGHLLRDTSSPEIFAEITALVPAQHTVANSTRLTFTPKTWEAAHAAIRLRGLSESLLGWYHTHPSRYWCTCMPEKQANCPLGKQFFSSDDIALHRTAFSRAYHIALVTGDRPAAGGGWEMTQVLYGWSGGMVVSRGFRVLPGQPQDELPEAQESAASRT